MRLAISLVAFVSVAAAQSAFNLTDRNAFFRYAAYPTATNSTAGSSSFAASGVNHVPNSWWYYHVSGDATGSVFNSAGNQFTTAVSADGRTGTLDWANVDGRNFAAKLINTVYSTSSFSAITAQSMTVTNNTGSPLSITIYAYADVDIDGISSDDSAYQMTGQAAGQMRITDASLNTVYFMGNGYGHWEAALWPTLRDAILTTAHTLPDGTLPLLNQDFSGAFSWTVTIAPGASHTANCLLSINAVPKSTNVASATEFGVAKPGSAGLPVWTLNRPFSGVATPLQITSGPTGAAPIVFIGTTTTNFPLPPLGTVYVIPVTTFNMPAFNASGVSTLNLNVPGLNSGVVHFQGLWADGGATGGVAHTSGLTWSIGSF